MYAACVRVCGCQWPGLVWSAGAATHVQWCIEARACTHGNPRSRRTLLDKREQGRLRGRNDGCTLPLRRAAAGVAEADVAEWSAAAGSGSSRGHTVSPHAAVELLAVAVTDAMADAGLARLRCHRSRVGLAGVCLSCLLVELRSCIAA